MVTKCDSCQPDAVCVTAAAPAALYATCTQSLRYLCKPHTARKLDSVDSDSR